MRTKTVSRAMRSALPIGLALAVFSCQAGVTPRLQTAGPGRSPTPAKSVAYLPLGDPNDPLLIAYCSAQDRVITLEGQLLSNDLPLSVALAKMRVAQRAARSAQEVFRGAGELRLAHLTSRWARSFDEVRARLGQGERPFDALRPAIAALGNIEATFTCELDG